MIHHTTTLLVSCVYFGVIMISSGRLSQLRMRAQNGNEVATRKSNFRFRSKSCQIEEVLCEIVDFCWTNKKIARTNVGSRVWNFARTTTRTGSRVRVEFLALITDAHELDIVKLE